MEQSNLTTNGLISQAKRLKFSHLSTTDRNNIEYYLSNGWKQAEIARKLGFNRSTISREIKRGSFRAGADSAGTHYKYGYDVGIRVAKENRLRSRMDTKLNKESQEIINLSKIINHEHVSVETALMLYKHFYHMPFPVCIKTVYKYIHKRYIKIKYPIRIKSVSESKPKQGKRLQRGKNISERPDEAKNRSDFGHFEGDLVVGTKGTKECVLTLVDRKGRTTLVSKLPDRTVESVATIFDEFEKILGPDDFRKVFKTITFDNGSEFLNSLRLKKSVFSDSERFEIYYANPYSSWERGTNENTNRMLRVYFPKKTDFSKVSNKKICDAGNRINFTSRRILGGKSSYEYVLDSNPELATILNSLGINNPFINLSKYLEPIKA
jgi:IS30 family transposase